MHLCMHVLCTSVCVYVCVMHFGIMRLVVCFISRVPVNPSSRGGGRGGSFGRSVLFELLLNFFLCYLFAVFILLSLHLYCRADVEMNKNSIAFLPLFNFCN